MAATLSAPEPIVAGDTERRAVAEVERFLVERPAGQVTLVGGDGVAVALPASVMRLLREAIRPLAHEQAIAIIPIQQRLTTRQAADLLNLSRQYFVRLLERGDIPFERVGTHRRLKLGDILAYKERRDAWETAALDDLILLGDDLGL